MDETPVFSSSEDVLLSPDYMQQLQEIITNLEILIGRADLIYTLLLFSFQCCIGVFICLLLYKAIKILI